MYNFFVQICFLIERTVNLLWSSYLILKNDLLLFRCQMSEIVTKTESLQCYLHWIEKLIFLNIKELFNKIIMTCLNWTLTNRNALNIVLVCFCNNIFHLSIDVKKTSDEILNKQHYFLQRKCEGNIFNHFLKGCIYIL